MKTTLPFVIDAADSDALLADQARLIELRTGLDHRRLLVDMLNERELLRVRSFGRDQSDRTVTA